MFGLGPMELGLTLAICVILFGAKRLPEIGSGIGGFLTNLRKGVLQLGDSDDDKPA